MTAKSPFASKPDSGNPMNATLNAADWIGEEPATDNRKIEREQIKLEKRLCRALGRDLSRRRDRGDVFRVHRLPDAHGSDVAVSERARLRRLTRD